MVSGKVLDEIVLDDTELMVVDEMSETADDTVVLAQGAGADPIPGTNG